MINIILAKNVYCPKCKSKKLMMEEDIERLQCEKCDYIFNQKDYPKQIKSKCGNCEKDSIYNFEIENEREEFYDNINYGCCEGYATNVADIILEELYNENTYKLLYL